jgi:hypothetical protein|tara:strand:+ start:1748 stop:2914 length:1167 start_codon:yes stop_codon:yes gene_type:complete
MFINFKKLFLNLENITICILFSIISFNALAAQNDSNFRNVEATGRAILIEGKIDVSRKRALEDALYIAALKGGANINGFSAIGSNTIINDQAIVSAANRVIDFKIIKETQEKEFLSIKIAAIVGGDLSSKNCKVRPINISLFKGTFNVGSDVPSILSRKMSLWFNHSYDIISKTSNVNVIDYRNKLIDAVIKSNINSSFDYHALTEGVPFIQSGDYSLVPNLTLTKNNFEENNFSNYLFQISFKIYKGSDFTLLPIKTYNFPIKYNLNSKFKFLKNISTLNINSVDEMIKKQLVKVTKSIFQDLHCRPLEGKLSLINGELKVDIGSKQGLKSKQIGIVRGLKIKNSMLSNSSVILHAEFIGKNNSKLLPLNDNIKLETLDNLIVEFVE